MKILVRCKSKENDDHFAVEMDCKVAFHFKGYDFVVHRDPDCPDDPEADFHVSELTMGAMAGYCGSEEGAVMITKHRLEQMDDQYFHNRLKAMKEYIDQHEFLIKS